jgi:hypothetical protein
MVVYRTPNQFAVLPWLEDRVRAQGTIEGSAVDMNRYCAKYRPHVSNSNITVEFRFLAYLRLEGREAGEDV